jgi:hypothetical protein
MRSKPTDIRPALRKALGATRPPEKITQEAFEFDEGHLRRMVRLEADERPTPDDLFDYLEDLRYTDIQTSLFVYLLSVLLEAWRNDVLGIDTGNAGTIEHFYPILVQRDIFSEHLTPKQTGVVCDFMRRTILEEIDEQRGLEFRGKRARAYRWIGEVANYGVLLPDIELLWNEWWSLSTTGRAVAAIQYISCLLYPENENPVFAPWTASEGGGPPCLWACEGFVYDTSWLAPNVEFLRKTLNLETVRTLLERAVDLLAQEPEHSVATIVRGHFAACEATVAARCVTLPKLLALEQRSEPAFTWPE